MLRTIRQVPEEGDRRYLRDWAREEFKRNKSVTNQVTEHTSPYYLCEENIKIELFHIINELIDALIHSYFV